MKSTFIIGCCFWLWVTAIVPDMLRADETLTVMTISRDTLAPGDFQIPETYYPVSVGLALSGGGARGLAQIGMLRAFEEADIPISAIAGSSIGSIVGGLYAAGYSAAEIEKQVARVDFTNLFFDTPRRRSLLFTQREERDKYLFSIRFEGLKPYIPQGLAAGQRLTNLLTDLTIEATYRCGGNFDRLPIPFRAAATDIATGELVEIGSGSLTTAMRASMAFPLAFTAVERDGRYLMDGGIVVPIPVETCRRMGADFVIALNTTADLLPVDKITDPIDVAGQVTTIMAQEALEEQLARADFVLGTDLEDIETFDFSLRDSLIELGYTIGREAVDDLLAALKKRNGDSAIFVDAVIPARSDKLLERLVAVFPIRPGELFQPDHLRQALLFADRELTFGSLEAAVISRGDSTIIVLDGIPNRRCQEVTYQFTGNTIIPDSILQPIFAVPEDCRLSLADVHESAQSMITLFHEAGYGLAYLQQIVYDHDAGQVTIAIDEGKLKYVDIRGNQRTRSWIIKANYPLRPGDPFDTRKSDNGIANIYGTGFFERVSLDLQPTAAGAHLTINVKEKKYTQFRFGAHWDDEYQAEAFGQLLDDNVFGAGLQMLLHGRISSRRYKYSFSVKVDRLSSTLLTARSEVYYKRLQRRLFGPDGGPDGYRYENRYGWSISAGQHIARLGLIFFEYRLENVSRRLSGATTELDDVLSTFAIKSSVETFDQYPFPNRGHSQELVFDFSGKWLGGTLDEYSKIYGSIEGALTPNKFFTIRPRFAIGLSTANLPDIEKYYIGGMYQFSGYRTGQLVGDKFLVTNWQIRLNLPYRFYLIGNFDYGNVFDEYEEIKIGDFLKGYGLTLAWNSPLGPVELGYGNAEKRPHRFYLYIGLRF